MNELNKIALPEELGKIVRGKTNNIIIPKTREELLELAMGNRSPDSQNQTFNVEYDIPGKGIIREATVTRCKNGIVVNYCDAYMRRRDSDSMVISDELPTDKPTHKERFGKSFNDVRQDTFSWFAAQDELILMPFMAGNEYLGLGYPALAVVPVNAAVFAMALSDLQGFVPAGEIPDSFEPRAIVYFAPPFRHTHYNGKQIVVHNRSETLHEVFSFNLYPGPSAKKGIYAVLLDIGEQEGWLTAHASAVQVVTPYELSLVVMHEGASGGGKSEMLETLHRGSDGKLLLAVNTTSGEETSISVADACDLFPIADDMVLCHPSIQDSSEKLVITDAEKGWFLRVDHITEYGKDPFIEKSTLHPQKPLLFFSLDAVPGSTCILWEPIMDEPGKPCPNPRVIIPRMFIPNHIDDALSVDVRSIGLRQPPSTRENPTYGIAGLFHILPPALAWLWRLVAPRGYANPSIVETGRMESEGVGAYWSFATGKMVRHANLLLEQIINSPQTKSILTPNQHCGVYKTNFSGLQLTREFLARRGGVTWKPETLENCRCPLLGFVPEKVKVDGTYIPHHFFHTNLQPELGNDGYDIGAAILTDFFKKELEKFLTSELSLKGRKIIEACLADVSAHEYRNLL